MGQYWTPILSNARLNWPGEAFADHITGWAYSHDFGSGLKLMEHSYTDNDFVGVITNRLIESSARVVWAGDYADPEPDGSGLNLYGIADLVHNAPFQITRKELIIQFRYLLNSSKKEYVDMTTLPSFVYPGWTDPLTIHPLPLLTAEGNGRGGGDFRGSNPYVGRWARDFIAITGVAGKRATPPKNWLRITPDFTED